MTKQQLLKAIEPFEDDIEIVILDSNNYKYSPRAFYSISSNGDSQFVLSARKPQGRFVEIKI